ncbi:MAG: sugar phosphate isomerase/epimerase, partial [candidate division KSB1 bacterium]|nr:sugar phosphate isomerase/epimerase [candidate division KSB1 bacterium]
MAKGLARRDFVRLCVLGLGAISSASWARCAKRRLRGPAEAGPASLGMQSYSLRNFDVLDAIRRTHELGLRHIEIFPGHLPVDADAERIRAVQAALQAHQMRLTAYGVVRFDKDEAAARRYFEFSKKMGIPALSADPEPTDETMGMLEKLASEYDV